MNNHENFFASAEEALRRSWAVHKQAFGPILEPAFQENQQVLIPLINALNHISRCDVKRGLDLLHSIKDQCIYDADKAAWCFFIGLAFEMSGLDDQMLRWYEKSFEYGHRFYLPYLKVAKNAHGKADFGKAKVNYIDGIACLEEMPDSPQKKILLGSTYINLCACLTMTHEYAEAVTAWNKAHSYPMQPASGATGAVLFAAMGDKERCDICIEAVKKNAPQVLEHAQDVTDKIYSGEHPHFCALPLSRVRMETFWIWFLKNEAELTSSLRSNDPSEGIKTLAERVNAVFTFLLQDARVSVKKDGVKLIVTLRDVYAVSLTHGYGELIALRPKELDGHWEFKVEH